MEVFKEFTFEAAHRIDTIPKKDSYSRLHGHSYTAVVYICGEADPQTGWVVEFAVLETTIQKLRKQLDHRFLNELEGLSIPTIENIAKWIWDRLEPEYSGLSKVVVQRKSCGEGCIFTGK